MEVAKKEWVKVELVDWEVVNIESVDVKSAKVERVKVGATRAVKGEGIIAPPPEEKMRSDSFMD